MGHELCAAGVPCGPIYPIDQMFDDAQVKYLVHRATRAQRREPPHPPSRPAGELVAHAEQDGSATAAVREQTEEVLAKFGFGKDEGDAPCSVEPCGAVVAVTDV